MKKLIVYLAVAVGVLSAACTAADKRIGAKEALEGILHDIHANVSVDTLRRFYNGIGSEYLYLEVRDMKTCAIPNRLEKKGRYHLKLVYREGLRLAVGTYYCYEVNGFRILSARPFFGRALKMQPIVTAARQSDTVSLFEGQIVGVASSKGKARYLHGGHKRVMESTGKIVDVDNFDSRRHLDPDGNLPAIK